MKKSIIQISEKKVSTTKEILLVEETPVTIFINGEEFVTLLCTPTNLKELAIGFLVTEKIITELEEIKDVLIDMDKGLIWVELFKYKKIAKASFGKRYLTSGCGKGTVFYHLNDTINAKPLPIKNKVAIETIFNFSKVISKREIKKNLKLGGIHKALFVHNGKAYTSMSDVGRHNAVDKVLGKLFLDGKKMTDGTIFTTGRISSEILSKSYTMGVSTIVSLSSPTSLSLKMAEELNITLVGYAKGKKAYIYTVPERIKSP